MLGASETTPALRKQSQTKIQTLYKKPLEHSTPWMKHLPKLPVCSLRLWKEATVSHGAQKRAQATENLSSLSTATHPPSGSLTQALGTALQMPNYVPGCPHCCSFS